MPGHDLLRDDLRTAYTRFLARRRKQRVASAAVLAAAAAACAALIGVGAFNGTGGAAQASGPGSDAYVKCLNAHGWPVGEGLSIDPNGNAPAPDVIDAAVTACRDLENGVLDTLRPSDDAFRQLGDQANRFASCMRDHGVDVGIPDVFRKRAGIGVTFPGYNPDATGFDDAYASCKSVMNPFG